MKKFALLCFVLFSFYPVYTQNTDPATIFKSATYTFSYFGNNLVNPGIKSSVNFTLTEKTTDKTKTGRTGKSINKSITKQLLAGANIGFFWQPESHIGVFNFYELTYRRIKQSNNSFYQFGAGPGIYRSFYPETFEVDNNGNVTKTPLGGRTYFAPVVTFGSGKFKKAGFLNALTFTTNLMFLFDYNSGVVPLLNLEIDFCFDFKKKHPHGN